MTTHLLKTINPYFDHVLEGRKDFELRKDDRGFKVGELVELREYNPEKGFSGAVIRKEIKYILRGPVYGLGEGWVILGLKEVKKKERVK